MDGKRGTPVLPGGTGRSEPRPLGPIFAVLGAAALFGTTGTALAIGPESIDALAAGSLRLLLGGAGLCLIAGRFLVEDLRSKRSGRFAATAFGGLAVACYQLGFFWATQNTGVALATVVTIGSSPLVARILGAARGRPSPDRWWPVAAATLILGLVLLVIGSSSADSSIDFDVLGVIAAVGAGAAYACYTEVGSSMLASGWHSTSAMAAMFLSAVLMTTPVLGFRDLSWLSESSGLGVILYLSFITLSISYVWFGWGLKRLPPTSIVMLTMFEPVIAAVLAIVVLDEILTPTSWLGLAVVLGGLVVVGLRSHTRHPATVET